LQGEEGTDQASQDAQQEGQAMSLATRLAALEARLHGSQLPPLGPGPIALMGLDGVAVVRWCWASVQPRLSGLPDLYGKAVWQDRATCPDAGACQNAETCQANGTGPGATDRVAKLD
jgi:hypothetical protein